MKKYSFFQLFLGKVLKNMICLIKILKL